MMMMCVSDCLFCADAAKKRPKTARLASLACDVTGVATHPRRTSRAPAGRVPVDRTPACRTPAIGHLLAVHLLTVHLLAVHLLGEHLLAVHLSTEHLLTVHLPAVHLRVNEPHSGLRYVTTTRLTSTLCRLSS